MKKILGFLHFVSLAIHCSESPMQLLHDARKILLQEEIIRDFSDFEQKVQDTQIDLTRFSIIEPHDAVGMRLLLKAHRLNTINSPKDYQFAPQKFEILQKWISQKKRAQFNIENLRLKHICKVYGVATCTNCCCAGICACLLGASPECFTAMVLSSIIVPSYIYECFTDRKEAEVSRTVDDQFTSIYTAIAKKHEDFFRYP